MPEKSLEKETMVQTIQNETEQNIDKHRKSLYNRKSHWGQIKVLYQSCVSLYFKWNARKYENNIAAFLLQTIDLRKLYRSFEARCFLSGEHK